MKFATIFSIVFLASVAVGPKVWAQSQRNLSLEDAIDLAQNKNVDISISKAQVEASNYALEEAKGNFLPKLSASANYNRNIDRPIIFLPNGLGTGGTATELGSDNDYRASLNLSMPIYSKFNNTSKSLAQSQLNIQEETARGIKQSVVNNVKKAYYAVLIIQEVLTVQTNRLNNALDIQRDIEKRVKQGTLTDYDLTSAKVQVSNAQANLIDTKSNLLPVRNNLKLLLGLESKTVLNLTAPIEILDSELIESDARAEMLAQNSQLQQLELETTLTENQIEATKAAYYPTLDVIGNYIYQTQADDFDLSNYNWVNTSAVGLQLQVPIFNGNITKNRVAQAEISKEIIEKQKEFATTQLQMQYEELLAGLQFSLEKTAVQRTNMVLTEEALQLAKKRYQFGVGTFLEVNDAELAYTAARLNWLQAISDYKTAYYDYQLLIGNDLN